MRTTRDPAQPARSPPAGRRSRKLAAVPPAVIATSRPGSSDHPPPVFRAERREGDEDEVVQAARTSRSQPARMRGRAICRGGSSTGHRLDREDPHLPPVKL